MSTFTTLPAAEDVDSATDTPAAQPDAETQRVLVDRSRRSQNGHGRRRAAGKSDKPQPKRQVSIPPIAVMLARPFLIVACVVLGGIVGFTAWGGKGYQATATVEFTSDGNDVALVQLKGQSLAQKITTEPVIQRAAAEINQPIGEIAAHTTATWQPQSLMIGVTAIASNGADAIARANAVAQSAVGLLSDSVDERLRSASTDADGLLTDQPLADPGAEIARRAQLGTSLGERQEALNAEAQSVFISKAADDVVPAGLTRTLSTAIGLAVGLFAGCLIAVMLGGRGLRAWSVGVVRRLAPGSDVLTPSETPQLAARIVEGGESYLAVVVTRRAAAVAESFIADLERILLSHGKTVTIVRPPAVVDEETAPLLRTDAPARVGELVGTDVLVVVLDAGTESAAMLEGQSGFRTVILMRQRRSPVNDGLSAARAYERATPVLMLGK